VQKRTEEKKLHHKTGTGIAVGRQMALFSIRISLLKTMPSAVQMQCLYVWLFSPQFFFGSFMMLFSQAINIHTH
jgi:hypothetical protein